MKVGSDSEWNLDSLAKLESMPTLLDSPKPSTGAILLGVQMCSLKMNMITNGFLAQKTSISFRRSLDTTYKMFVTSNQSVLELKLKGALTSL